VDPISERARYHFTVKVYPSRQFYSACDPIAHNFAIAGDGVFGFDLPEGTAAQCAAEVANFLNGKLLCLTYTLL
jgi:hypothetical protein